MKKITRHLAITPQLQKLKNIGDNYVYLVVDETTNPRGLYIANLLIGVLSAISQSPFLISCKQFEKTNHKTISHFINDTLKIISADIEFNNKVFLLVTDAAPFMVKAGKCLKVFFINMIRVTYAAHINLCYRLAEKVRETFPD